MSKRFEWYFVSIVDCRTSKIHRRNVDAVLACSAIEATGFASERNPVRPDEIIGLRKVLNGREKREAVRLNDVRITQISELIEIVSKLE